MLKVCKIDCKIKKECIQVFDYFAGYMCYVGRAYRRLGGKKCYNMIKNATTYYQNLFANRQHAKAKELLKLCNKVENKKDEWAIFSTIANYFAGIAQYQR